MTSPANDPKMSLLRPPSRWPNFGFVEAWRMRRILFVLAQRLLLVRYRQAVLGFAWIIIQPLVLSLIMAVFLGLALNRGSVDGIPFPLYIFAAWVPFRVFTRVVSEGATSVSGNGSLVQRIYLPRMFFPLSIAIATLADYAAMVVTMLVLMLLYGYVPGLELLMLPLTMAILYAAGLGVGFFFAASSLRYQDMTFVIPLLTQVWFWASPIFYSSAIVPAAWRHLYYLNPMVVTIEATRWAFLGSAHVPAPTLSAWVIGASSAGIMLVAGFFYFKQREPVFADLM